MGDMRSWMIRKATGTAPFDSEPASIVGPDTETVEVVPSARVAALTEALEVVIANLDGENEDGNIFPAAALARARSVLASSGPGEGEEGR